MAKTIQLIGEDKLRENLQQIAQHYSQELGEALLAEIFKILAISSKKIKTDTGLTKASQYTELEIRQGQVTAEGGYKNPNALWLDQGTKPHRPPIQPLKEWALRKRIASDEDEAEAIAWGIAKIIERFGTNPDLFFTNTVNEQRSKLERAIGKFILAKQNELARKVK